MILQFISKFTLFLCYNKLEGEKMRELNNLDKVSLIKKYYKRNPVFLELNLVNYEKYNLYICINEIDKNSCYRLSWFDLDDIN